MQPEWPILPELDQPREHAEPRPVGWPRHGADAELGGELRDPLLELEAGGQRTRLLRSPGADLAGARPRREIGVGLFRGHLLHGPFDTHLALRGFPVKAERRLRMGQQLSALAALVVGVEDESAVIHALEQHHPQRGHAVRPDGGQRHRVRLVRLLVGCGLEPLVELLEGVALLVGHPLYSCRAGPDSALNRRLELSERLAYLHRQPWPTQRFPPWAAAALLGLKRASRSAYERMNTCG